MADIGTLPLSGCRVLVVEDDYFLADDIVQALQAAGADIVGPINTIEEALELAKEAGLDVAILDINVRGTMTFAVAEELSRRAVPFVFATGYDRAAVPTSLGRVPRWEKPFDPTALVDALPALIGCGERRHPEYSGSG